MWFDAFFYSRLKRCVQANMPECKVTGVASNAVVCASSVCTLHHRVTRRLLINLQFRAMCPKRHSELFLDNN